MLGPLRRSTGSPPPPLKSGLDISRPNLQQSAAKARSPAELNNLNLLGRNFPPPFQPAGLRPCGQPEFYGLREVASLAGGQVQAGTGG